MNKIKKIFTNKLTLLLLPIMLGIFSIISVVNIFSATIQTFDVEATINYQTVMGTKINPLLISNESQFKKYVLEYGGIPNTYFKQTSDFIIENASPLKNSEFKGIYDGNGYKITITNNNATRLFKSISETGIIKNLTIESSALKNFEEIDGEKYSSAVAFSVSGIIENVTIINNCDIQIENSSSYLISGVANYMYDEAQVINSNIKNQINFTKSNFTNDSNITFSNISNHISKSENVFDKTVLMDTVVVNCDISVDENCDCLNFAGIINQVDEKMNTLIKNVQCNINISQPKTNKMKEFNFGGLVGICSNYCFVEIFQCSVNLGAQILFENSNVGGLVLENWGALKVNENFVEVESLTFECFSSSNINTVFGGLIASNSKAALILNCSCNIIDVDIISNNVVFGGLIGESGVGKEENKLHIINSYFFGNIYNSETDNKVAGIIGLADIDKSSEAEAINVLNMNLSNVYYINNPLYADIRYACNIKYNDSLLTSQGEVYNLADVSNFEEFCVSGWDISRSQVNRAWSWKKGANDSLPYLSFIQKEVGTKFNPITINSVAEWNSTDFSVEKYYTLTTNISFQNPTTKEQLSANLDCAGYSIDFSSSSTLNTLFVQIGKTGVLKNLNIIIHSQSASLIENKILTPIAEKLYGKIENVNAVISELTIVTTDDFTFGGLVAFALNNAKIINCKTRIQLDLELNGDNIYYGGIVGIIKNDEYFESDDVCEIINCVVDNYNNSILLRTDIEKANIGGVVGLVDNTNAHVIQSVNSGDLVIRANLNCVVAGIVGEIINDGFTVEIVSCVQKAESMIANNVFEVVDYIEFCCGGIVGGISNLNDGVVNIKKSYSLNWRPVLIAVLPLQTWPDFKINVDNAIGGLIGNLNNSASVMIENCYSIMSQLYIMNYKFFNLLNPYFGGLIANYNGESLGLIVDNSFYMNAMELLVFDYENEDSFYGEFERTALNIRAIGNIEEEFGNSISYEQFTNINTYADWDISSTSKSTTWGIDATINSGLAYLNFLDTILNDMELINFYIEESIRSIETYNEFFIAMPTHIGRALIVNSIEVDYVLPADYNWEINPLGIDSDNEKCIYQVENFNGTINGNNQTIIIKKAGVPLFKNFSGFVYNLNIIVNDIIGSELEIDGSTYFCSSIFSITGGGTFNNVNISNYADVISIEEEQQLLFGGFIAYCTANASFYRCENHINIKAEYSTGENNTNNQSVFAGYIGIAKNVDQVLIDESITCVQIEAYKGIVAGFIGVLIGGNSTLKINSSYNSSKLKLLFSGYVAGFIGNNQWNLIIENSYSLAYYFHTNPTNSVFSGMILETYNNVLIKHSYVYFVNLLHEHAQLCGFIYQNASTVIIENSFCYGENLNYSIYSEQLEEGVTTIDIMRNNSTYASWNIEIDNNLNTAIWQKDEQIYYGIPFLSWQYELCEYGTHFNPYIINDFQSFKEIVTQHANNPFAEFLQTAEILEVSHIRPYWDMAPLFDFMIKSFENFYGVYDANNNKIILTSGGEMLFENVFGVIKNLNIEIGFYALSSYSSISYYGALIYNLCGILDNISIYGHNTTVINGYSFDSVDEAVWGFLASRNLGKAKIINCTNYLSLTDSFSGDASISPFIGSIESDIELINLTNYGDFSITMISDNSYGFAGGIVATAQFVNVKFENLINYGNIEVYFNNNTPVIGGVIGVLASVVGEFNNLANYGNIIVRDARYINYLPYIGGIIGFMSDCNSQPLDDSVKDIQISNSLFCGNIEILNEDNWGNSLVGGLIGAYSNSSATIVNSYATCTLIQDKGGRNSVGGFIGALTSTTSDNAILEIKNCFNDIKIEDSSSRAYGGIYAINSNPNITRRNIKVGTLNYNLITESTSFKIYLENSFWIANGISYDFGSNSSNGSNCGMSYSESMHYFMGGRLGVSKNNLSAIIDDYSKYNKEFLTENYLHYYNWDIREDESGIWNYNPEENCLMPYLSWQDKEQFDETNVRIFEINSIDDWNVYLGSSIYNNSYTSLKLTADLNFDSIVLIGDLASRQAYSYDLFANLDCNGYTISIDNDSHALFENIVGNISNLNIVLNGEILQGQIKIEGFVSTFTAQASLGLKLYGKLENIKLYANKKISLKGSYAGGLIAYATKSFKLLNCENFAEFIIYGANCDYVGGLLGYGGLSLSLREVENHYSMTNSINHGNLYVIFRNSNECDVGGIAGLLTGNMKNCYNLCEEVYIEHAQAGCFGGIVGSSYGKIESSACLCDYKIIGENNFMLTFGGLVGYMAAYSESIISNSFSKGNCYVLQNSSNLKIAGLVGAFSGQSLKIINCYSDINCNVDFAGLVSKTQNVNIQNSFAVNEMSVWFLDNSYQIKNEYLFNEWNISDSLSGDSVWIKCGVYCNSGLPILRDLIDFGNLGSKNNPIVINNVQDWESLLAENSENPDYYFILGEDLVFDSHVPIANFKANLNGNGKYIIANSENSLFSVLSGVVSGLKITNAFFKNSNNFKGLADNIKNDSNILNCYINEKFINISNVVEISSVDDWNNIEANSPLKYNYFIQTNDIVGRNIDDLTLDYIQKISELTGVYDGNGHTLEFMIFSNCSRLFETISGTLRNLKIICSSMCDDDYGCDSIVANILFGEIDNVEICGKENIHITYILPIPLPNHYFVAGGVVTLTIANAAIKNVKINVNFVLGNVETFGSIAGAINTSIMENCISNSNITINNNCSTLRIGGLVGLTQASSIINCIYGGNIEVENNSSEGVVVGGIVGSGFASIYQSASRGNVEVKCTSAVVGGIVGQILSSNNNSIEESFSECVISVNTLSTSSNPSYIGGLVGFVKDFTISINNCFSNVEFIDSSANFSINNNFAGMIGVVEVTNINQYTYINNSYSVAKYTNEDVADGYLTVNGEEHPIVLSGLLNTFEQDFQYTLIASTFYLNDENTPKNSIFNNNVFGECAKTLSEMRYCLTYANRTDKWNIALSENNSVWIITETENNGLPYLSFVLTNDIFF